MDQALAGEDFGTRLGESPWRLASLATIFLAALLLFAVEPLIAKIILPWFGGSASVWMVCLLFFQAALLGGYLLAHVMANHVPAYWQRRLQAGLLVLSLAFLPILPAAHWKPVGGENPLILILGLLAATIGLPFLLLASTTPLLTQWIANGKAETGWTLTRFYALSNLGSMIALVSYPVLVEPYVTTHAQAMIWSFGYVGFVVLATAVSWWLAVPAPPLSRPAPAGEPFAVAELLFWFLLPMMTSALLLAVTDHILRNIAAIPLLWVAPLALYLLSLVICFDSPRWYYRPVLYFWFAVMTGAMIYLLVGLFLVQGFLPQLLFYLAGFFVCCMVCHGELASLRPAPRFLSAFYLCIAAGGAAGGLFVAALAPLIFKEDLDVLMILPATALLVTWVVFRRWPREFWRPWGMLALGLALLLWLADTGWMAKNERDDLARAAYAERNFYGALRVRNIANVRVLQNGNVVHGRELLTPALSDEPASYYGPHSGLGRALTALEKRGPLKIGVLGLGAGTIAAYGRPGDNYVFYEINPAVSRIAQRYFGFLPMTKASWRVEEGDGRLSLERERSQGFDLLAIDAFTSDSIPVHLLTREAFGQYWRHLKPGGILAVHISNLYIDLAPVVAFAAQADGMTSRLVSDRGDDSRAEDPSDWVLISAEPGFFGDPALAGAAAVKIPPNFRVWTDDYSNLWRSLR